ncbi:hypothetical protein NGG16_03110 [Enterococcus casseliflavus]|uniref:hypothetical protein n=1 Tax=Enterococcus casseliflavus TaxID=37734 RepID=UPI002DBE1A18|nr:hypothetical protein [Enterococcus casseliflavus]MEB8416424.1 hypothetical protein [Enterococcus casseliflavus]
MTKRKSVKTIGIDDETADLLLEIKEEMENRIDDMTITQRSIVKRAVRELHKKIMDQKEKSNN